MKAVKSTRSMRSIRSARSGKTGKIIDDIQSLDNMLVMACAKFNCPYSVTVKKEMKQDEYYKALKETETKVRSKRISLMAQNREPEIEPIEPDTSVQTTSLTNTSSTHVNNILVTMIYDNFNTLTEIRLANVKHLPQILLKIIGLLAPYYRNIMRITINSCGINMYTINELGKILNVSTITEIILDGSSLPGGDYSLLLESTNLRNLSLCRCKVNDDACKIIASKLHHGATADKLSILNLSTNHISVTGAKYFAESLRTNRHLRYLNLSDNHISDDGAGYLLDMLIEFPLTYDEILDMRRRRLDYFKSKETLYLKYLAEYCKKSNDDISQVSRKSTTRRKKSSTTTIKSRGSARKEKERSNSVSATEDIIKAKADIMAAEILGPFQDPFDFDSTTTLNGYNYYIGNMTLIYLNLAYNNLSYVTVKKLYQVLLYQNVKKSPNRTGLIKVVLDGNNLPVNCTEMTLINDLMVTQVWQLSSKVPEVSRRKSRPESSAASRPE